MSGTIYWKPAAGGWELWVQGSIRATVTRRERTPHHEARLTDSFMLPVLPTHHEVVVGRYDTLEHAQEAATRAFIARARREAAHVDRQIRMERDMGIPEGE